LIADPSILISRFGFAWFGGFLAGFVGLLCFWRGVLEFRPLNSWTYVSPAAAVGYAIGRIGLLVVRGRRLRQAHIVVLALGDAFSRRRRSYYRKPVCNGAGRPTAALPDSHL